MKIISRCSRGFVSRLAGVLVGGVLLLAAATAIADTKMHVGGAAPKSTGKVCRLMQPPGSLIKRLVCVTPQELALERQRTEQVVTSLKHLQCPFVDGESRNTTC